MNTFGQKIKYLRQDQNLTQKALAEKLSITVSTLSHWECDYQEPSFDDLSKICSFFDVEADYLIGIKSETGIIPLQKEKFAPSLSPDEQDLIDDYRALAPALQEMLRATIQTWKKTNANAKPNKSKNA